MRSNVKTFTITLGYLAFVLIQQTNCEVRLPRLVSDGMVLQRDVAVRVWGWASPGEKVAVKFLGRTDTTTTGTDGRWTIILSPTKVGGPYSMEIDANNHVTLKNILVGDAWVCSGQSNMELPMERVKSRYAGVIARSENPNIRQFIVPHRYDFGARQKDLPSGRWESANPWSVLQFTAAGYFFAKTLFEKYHVPIGLINASVGGTPSYQAAEGMKFGRWYRMPGSLVGESERRHHQS